LGILWQLDRATGAFIRATDLGYQNIVQVNPQTGKVTYLPGMIPRVGVEVAMCPSTSGFKSWRAMAFNPQTNALYIPLTLNCERAIFGAGPQRVVGGGGSGSVGRTNYKHPESEGNLGEFLAMDIRTGRVLWRQRTPSPSNTAALSTAGGLAFGGDWDRHMYAYDAATNFRSGLSNHVSGKRKTVRCDARGNWRRKLVHADHAGTGSGNSTPEFREYAAGVCAAVGKTQEGPEK
ncbi:MAG: hypothetical protein DMG11_17420, partial [Acidobacteria bacterium]